MKCKLTGDEGRGVKAHIIPRSFYRFDYSQPVPLKILTNSENGYNGKSFVGIYDSTIVTERGERLFSDWDNYAETLLLKERNNFSVRKDFNGEILCLYLPTYDYAKLKLFFLSVLWRASVSSQTFFQKVDLGSHEQKVRHAILESDPGPQSFYSVVLARFTDIPVDHVAMLDPFLERYESTNFYRLFLGTYVAYIKVDSRPVPATLNQLELRPNTPLVIIGREFHSSEEKKIMTRLVIEK